MNQQEQDVGGFDPGLGQLADSELRALLLTCDGRGHALKAQALETLLSRARPQEKRPATLDAGAPGAPLPRDVVARAEQYTDTFCSLTSNTCGEISTRFHAAVLLHELRGLRRYCGALEEQMDEFGLKSAQRAVALEQPR